MPNYENENLKNERDELEINVKRLNAKIIEEEQELYGEGFRLLIRILSQDSSKVY